MSLITACYPGTPLFGIMANSRSLHHNRSMNLKRKIAYYFNKLIVCKNISFNGHNSIQLLL